jgi:hypothetical protein
VNISGNTIFIPGATSGIGLALAIELQAKDDWQRVLIRNVRYSFWIGDAEAYGFDRDSDVTVGSGPLLVGARRWQPAVAATPWWAPSSIGWHAPFPKPQHRRGADRGWSHTERWSLEVSGIG